MFSNSHFDRLRQLFADQFEPYGSGFLYRKFMKGAPIRVSSDERDAFILTFNQRLRYSAWSIVPATVLLIGLLVWLVPDADSTVGKVAMWFGIAAILVPFVAGCYWAWNAPARELGHRPQEGMARSRDKVRHLMFSRMTYRQLGFAALAVIALVWKVSAHTDVFHGLGVLWLVSAGLLVASAAVQAFRKWRHERGRT